MRQVTIVLNSIVVIFFSGFLAYTFIAREHLNAQARAFVTEKTLQYSAPIVEVAEQSIDSPLVQKLLSEDQIAAVRHEIAEYRRDGAAYVADLTRQKPIPPQIADPHPLLAKVAATKERIENTTTTR